MVSKITKLTEPALELGKPKSIGVAVDQTAILVLGMHRSGTSAATRVINLLGADLPVNIMLPKAENNEAGFWESLDLYQLNDKILESAGSSWDDWRRFNRDWIKSPASEVFKTQALEILQHDFSRSPFFVLKDPRICRLLPFWLDVFREFGSDVKCVLPLRNPLEVAASLKKRDGFSPAKSYMLWLRHVLDAEMATRKLPRVFIAYDDLLADWRDTVDEVGRQLKLAWPRQSATSNVEVEKFLDERHRHHCIELEDIDQRSDVAGWVRRASKALAKLLSDPDARKPKKRLDAIRAEFNRASDALGAVLRAEELAKDEAERSASLHVAELAEARVELSQQQAEAQALKKQATEKDDDIAQLRATVAERDEKATQLERHVSEQDGVIGQLRAALVERDERVAQLERRASEQNGVIDELRARAVERDEKTAELERRADDRDRVIDQLRATLTEREGSLTGLVERTREQKDHISSLESENNELQQNMRRATNELGASQTRLDELVNQVAGLDHGLRERERLELSLREAKSELEDERKRLLHRLNDLQTRDSAKSVMVRTVLGRRANGAGPAKRGLPPRKCFDRVLSRDERRRIRNEANLILTQRLFDFSWYVEKNPDVVLAGADPVWHWLTVGWQEGRDPNPLFDTDWYLEENSDVADAGINPLVHYLRFGVNEARDPNPLFDTDWYLEKNPDVADARVNPLVHYLRFGETEGRDPNPFFDSDWYLAHNPDLKAGHIDQLAHYLHNGGSELRDPSALFDTSYYVKRNPDVIEQKMNPLVHFFAKGADISEAKEVWSDSTALNEAGRFISAEEKNAQLQPSERFVTGLEAYNPKVTVVVPNYNHAPYLHERLDSIFKQTYSNIHVVLLDDCSSDNSREVLTEYKNKYPGKTTLVFNETNSGGVFKQWRKGIEIAESDLIWIAESDDFCDEDFLSELIPYFMDESVALAYSHSIFVDEMGRRSQSAFENYLAELSPDRWRSSYVSTAHDEVAQFLGRKNTIPNVSSAVFRKPDLAPLVEDDSWLSMKICGDWVFYLHLLKGGKIAYSANTHNYFRFHSSNSSAKTYSKPDYYREHEAVACEVARNYRVPDETLEANRFFVERFYNDNAAELMAAGMRFSDLFNEQRVSASREQRKPNLMMAAFALSTGGGEVFPIRLANYLKTQGFAITFFNFMGEAFNPAVRRMLRADIPLVERNEWCPAVEVMLEQFGIEVVHTHHASVDVYFGAHNKVSGAGAKHVVTMHGTYEAMSQEVFDLTLGKIADEVAAWVYIAEKNLAPFKSADLDLRGGFTKIPNGMQPPIIRHLDRSDYGVPEDAFLVCLASRAIPEKGWRKAIEIVDVAREASGKEVHLLLLGDGPVYEDLSVEQLPDYVHLLGFRENVVDFYAMSDLGLLPTTFEGESFPLSIIECFMAGRPIMVSDVGEVRNMLSAPSGDLAGLLIDVTSGTIDERGVGEQLARLATSDEAYRTRKHFAEVSATRFDIKHVSSEYAKVYRS